MKALDMRCQTIHRLVAESLDRDLSLGERVRVRSHLWVCASCTHFGQQMQFLRDAMRHTPDPGEVPPDEESR